VRGLIGSSRYSTVPKARGSRVGERGRGVRFRFDAFVLDEDARQLLRSGREVHLSPKAFDLLARLIEARPRALSKAELDDYLWPGTFVTDASLGMLVTEIRGALGDSAQKPRFLRTLHRFGYAFQASVAQLAAAASSAAGRTDVVYWLVSPSRQIALAPGENLVGRDPQAAVWLDSPAVSRHHARITIGDRVMVEDLGSKNGPHVRGCAVTAPTPLDDGDEICFGSMRLTFRVWTTSGSTASEA
jgi:DNA-binding winged helix-turn-helix (wHTH) protein